MCRNCFKYAEYLSEFDRAVLDIIFTSELPYLDLLYKQISVAAVSDSDCVSSYFIDLCVKETVLPIPTSVSVPVSIEICPDCEPVSADREISEHFRQTGTARWLETGEQSPEFTLPQGYDAGAYLFCRMRQTAGKSGIGSAGGAKQRHCYPVEIQR